jgi:hypothetical protein
LLTNPRVDVTVGSRDVEDETGRFTQTLRRGDRIQATDRFTPRLRRGDRA